MAIEKFQIRPEGTDDYGTTLHPETSADIVLMSDGKTVEQSINEHKADYTYQTASGTGTAITLTINNLKDGYPITFIASTSNNGASTTINGKALYKPNTTTTPTLIAGKAYTVWYNQSGDCFFIKASAEGTASVSNVLAGKTFSNDNDTGLTGTIPSKSAQTYTPRTTAQTIASGQYLSGTQTIKGDTNLIAANILSGKSIFGVSGNVVGIKKATGSITTSGGNSHTVTGVGFRADVIIVIDASRTDINKGFYCSATALGTTESFFFQSGNSDGYSNDGFATTTSGFTFQTPRSSSDVTIKWLAIKF